MNSKTTARPEIEKLGPKIFLPRKQQHKQPRSRRGKQNGRKAGSGPTRGGGSVSTMVYEPWLPIFPASITKRLRYSCTFAGSCTTGAITSTQVFRANDLFDPDFTGTGHQPMGFDQLMVWYNHFCVRTAKIICSFKCTSNSAPTVCLRVDADSTPLTVIDRILELGYCASETLELKSTYGANKKLEMTIDIAKLQGVKPSALTADANLRGTAASSPSEVSYFHITSWDTVATTTGSFECDVILEQVATFFEPRDITESLAARIARPTAPDIRVQIPDGESKSVKPSSWF